MKHDMMYLECVINLTYILWRDETEAIFWLRLAVLGRKDQEKHLRDLHVWHLQWDM